VFRPSGSRRVSVLACAIAVVASACAATYGAEDNNKTKPAKVADASVQDGGGDRPAPSDEAGASHVDPGPYSAAVCASNEKCFPLYLKAWFGTSARCVTAVTADTQSWLLGQGNAITSDQLAACAAKIATSCVEVYETIPECDFKGTRADGQPCNFGAQCASGDCFKAKSAADCGVCKGQNAEGGSCTDADCTPNLFCIKDKCVAPARESEACSDAKPCDTHLACVGGTCAKLLPNGGRCQLADMSCDYALGLSCFPVSATAPSGVCTAALFAGLGQTCGLDSSTQVFTDCEASTCSSATALGTCVDYLAIGAPCTADGPSCAWGSSCVDGKCKSSDPTACN
jgi:hypothetical protein